MAKNAQIKVQVPEWSLHISKFQLSPLATGATQPRPVPLTGMLQGCELKDEKVQSAYGLYVSSHIGHLFVLFPENSL